MRSVQLARLLLLLVCASFFVGLLTGWSQAQSGSSSDPPSRLQAQPETPEQPTQEPTVEPTGEPTVEPTEQPPEEPTPTPNFGWLGALILLFATGVVIAIILYLVWVQGRYYGLVGQSLTRLGAIPDAKDVGPVQLDVAEASRLNLTGPSVIVVGESTEYSAKDGDLPVNARWQPDPADAAEVQPAEGASVRVTAKKAAAFILEAQAGDEQAGKKGRLAIAAVTVKEGTKGAIRFVGEGWGGLLIAVVAFAVIAALALVGVLTSEVVSTLFGALLGYVFVRAATREGGSQAEETGRASSDETGKK